MIDYPKSVDDKRLQTSFLATRNYTGELCRPLITEDYSVQPIDFVSPPKWHLAHSTWFFEQFILLKFNDSYRVYNEDFSYLFNSYYNNLGTRVLRPNRGNMTRPSIEEVFAYRKHITSQVMELIGPESDDEILRILEIGINHEQQHQELLAYDIKYILGNQPTLPPYKNNFALEEIKDMGAYVSIEKGIYEIGHKSDSFSFDNELGLHKVYLNSFEIAKNLITNGEFIEFIEDGGYKNFNLWHADGWDWVEKNKVNSPLYWHNEDGIWKYYNFEGLAKVNLNMPVSHISYYEAYAFAEWKGLRLPTEFEWEVASGKINWGQLWEWTNSAYLPYPNFKKADGALGEYNGKFMINQMVMRGSAVTTPQGHERYTYRNFFKTDMRWMFSGIRLAR